VDRLRRRPILIVSDLARAALLLSVPLTAVVGVLRIEQLYVVAFGVGLLSVVFQVAHQSLVPALVGREQIVEGNAKLSVSSHVAEVSGPALGGLLAQWFSAHVVLVVDAVSFVWSALLIGRIRAVEPPPPPHAERRPVASNAEGARLASLDPTLAAIASTRAGSEYGLHVVSPAIQDDANNRTRFAVVTHPDRHPAPRASGHDCTSLVVSVLNRPGAVHDMLVPLKANGVSMTRFESRPARSGQWEYYFYIDLQGHPDQPHVATALRELREACAFFKLLGTYPIDVH
jgi:hypothetical protein